MRKNLENLKAKYKEKEGRNATHLYLNVGSSDNGNSVFGRSSFLRRREMDARLKELKATYKMMVKALDKPGVSPRSQGRQTVMEEVVSLLEKIESGEEGENMTPEEAYMRMVEVKEKALADYCETCKKAAEKKDATMTAADEAYEKVCKAAKK